MATSLTLRKQIPFAVLLAVVTAAGLVIAVSGVPALFLLILVSVITGCLAWWLAGRITPILVAWYLRLHALAAGSAAVSRETILVDGHMEADDGRWSMLHRSLRLSLFPTVIGLSLIGYILRDIGSLGSRDVYVVLYFTPVFVVFIVPLWIVQDSPLYYHDSRSGEVISMGHLAGIRLKSVGGLLALALVAYTLYTVTGSLQAAAWKLTVFFSHIYLTVVATSTVYHARWHHGFTGRATTAAETAGKQRRRVRLEAP